VNGGRTNFVHDGILNTCGRIVQALLAVTLADTSLTQNTFPAGTRYRKLLENQTRATLASGPRSGPSSPSPG